MEDIKDYTLKDLGLEKQTNPNKRYSVTFQFYSHKEARLENYKILTLAFKTKKEAYEAMNKELNNIYDELLINRKKQDKTLDFVFKNMSWFINEEIFDNLYQTNNRMILNSMPYIYKN
jgi:uncharacterized protein YqgQ